MKSRGAQHVLALTAGLLFGAGLIVSGMTQPSKVIGFLDPFGRFDASLAFVMLGAIAVHALAYLVKRRRAQPLLGGSFLVPTRTDLDTKLLAGATLFGLGWGLAGYCPGPAIVSLLAGGWTTTMFVAAMLTGMFITAKLEASPKPKRTAPSRLTTAHH